MGLTPLGVGVLALLEERPMHPYEMYQLLVSRGQDRLVKLRPGSLYHTVSRLAERELVRSEGVDRDGNRPERTTYRITDYGRESLRTRVSQMLTEPAQEYPEFSVALAEAHNLPKEDVLALLRERVSRLEADLADIESIIEAALARKSKRRYWIVLPYLHATTGAQIEWVNGFIADLISGEMEWAEFDPATGGRIDTDDEACSAHVPDAEPMPHSAESARKI
ncbi:PadR family transcriptional regulator [Nocardia callitridis]|uniref:PadR family transcriptional regulator n=1 Tax=Nocardia callitridis TaxID=648753 RepID=A0ABP9JR63_9NOCA